MVRDIDPVDSVFEAELCVFSREDAFGKHRYFHHGTESSKNFHHTQNTVGLRDRQGFVGLAIPKRELVMSRSEVAACWERS